MAGASTGETGIRMNELALKNREKIMNLEAVMKAMPEHQIEFKVQHHFSPGIYMREIFIPKGATLTGKIHKTEHLNILSQGHMMIATETGVKPLVASTVVLSKPGTKRAGYAIVDSVWITVHPNPDDELDVLKLEDRLVVESFEQFQAFAEKLKIEGKN